jgi:hypothetical protein
VHWVAMLIVDLIAMIACYWTLPQNMFDSAITLLWSAWIVYLCLWIRKIDPTSKSIVWAVASIGIGLVLDGFNLLENPSLALGWVICVLWIASLVMDFVVIFAIRAELQKHYNEREPVGLYLSGIMTFFFSYFYFQYHLYDIAQFKKRQAEGIASVAGRPLLP